MSTMHEKDAVKFEELRDRPFDPAVVTQAQALAARYHIKVSQHPEGYLGTVQEFPSVVGQGTSEPASLDKTRDLLMWAIAYLIETGRTPAPNSP